MNEVETLNGSGGRKPAGAEIERGEDIHAGKKPEAAWKAFCSLRRMYSKSYGLIEGNGTAREFIARAFLEMGYHLDGLSVSSTEEVGDYLSKLICRDQSAIKQFDTLQSISAFYYSIVEDEKYGESSKCTAAEIAVRYGKIKASMEAILKKDERKVPLSVDIG